ncbi:glycosyltransferase family 4 protein [Candidatus Woesearchaeota archaeon]|jgi:glycosyltransferase involved in cell wall biosynthesis|nr:glycosyltransferase family 4 protein [Candidatus Woesearchaeota archaeon]
MNILFPFPGDSVGGNHWSAINLYKELRKKSEVNVFIVIHIADGPLSQLLDRINIPYTILPIKHLAGENEKLLSIIYRVTLNLRLIYSFIIDNKIDIVHGNDLRINLTWSLPVRISKAKYIWHQRQLLSDSIKWHMIDFLSDYVISISEYVYKTFPANIGNSKKSIINNPFDIYTLYDKKDSRNIISNRYKINNSFFMIGYIGRLAPCKNIEIILHALKKIILTKSCEFKFHLLIVGEGDNEYKRRLINITDSNGLKDYVTFTGFVDNSSLILSSLDLLIASSTNEPFGRVLVESMLQKTLVLASNLGGHLEIVQNNKTGLLYDASSVQSLCDQIINVMSKQYSCNNITELAYDNATVHYNSSNHADSVIYIYQKLLKL